VSQLEAHGVGVELGGSSVLEDVSLRFSGGQVTVVIGPNGAGKSTLLRALAGLQRLSAGTVTLDGIDLRDIARRTLASQLSFVPQSSQFPFAFTVREVVATGRNPHTGRFQRERAQDRESIERAFALTDIAHLENRAVTELSGGERQRVMIARSLATEADIILLDEPTANLDPAHALDILQMCRSMAAAGTLVILTTQDLSMAIRYADRIALMKLGEAVATGTCDEVLTDSALDSVFGVRGSWVTAEDGEQALVLHRLESQVPNR
jgi:iron complex transport system ATP-binding protein